MAITVTDPRPIDRAEEILTPEALGFIEELHKRFAGTRNELLQARKAKRQQVAETSRLTSSRRPGRFATATGRSPRLLRLCRTAVLK